VHLRELFADLDVLEWVGNPDVEVVVVTHDSRRVEPGALFACLPGTRTDGHDHATEAVAAGARALMTERILDLDVPQARVTSVRKLLGFVASRAAGDPSRALQCLGITGTNGKTTTVHALASIARSAGRRAATVGTLGVRGASNITVAPLTTPEAPDLQRALAALRDAGVDTVAMEVSSHALAQHRVDGTWFAAACFINLTHDHLEYHGSIESYFEAKALLFVPERVGAAAVNLDDPFGATLANRVRAAGIPLVDFARHDPRARLTVEDTELRADGSTFVLHDRAVDERQPVTTPLIGGIGVENSLAAAATAMAADLDLPSIATGLAAVEPIAGRLEPVRAGQRFTVLVDYAHTPDALERALAAVRPFADRVVLVFGCGGDRDRTKRPLMGRAARDGAHVVVLTSDNPRSEEPEAIAAEVLAGIGNPDSVRVELDRRAAIAWALAVAGADDVVLIAGKGHEQVQIIGANEVPFDDRAVARELLEERRCS